MALGCAALLLSACGGGDQADGTEDGKPALNQEELDALLSAVASAKNLEPQLYDLRDRLNIMCMEKAGFDVHPGAFVYQLTEYAADAASLAGDPPELTNGYLPTLDHATEFGYEIDPSAQEDKGHIVDTGFDEQPQEYIDRYYATLMGPRYTESLAGKGQSAPDGLPEATGCEVATAETLYGSLETAVPAGEGDPDSEYFSELTSLPAPEAISPYTSAAAYEASPVRVAAFDAWAPCVEEAGHPYFEGTTIDDLDRVGYYLELFSITAGQGEADDEDGKGRYDGMAPPQGAPFSEEVAAEKKREFAVVVAECADQVGLRETIRAEWSNAMLTTLAAAEVEIFAWYTDMQQAIENGQKALEA